MIQRNQTIGTSAHQPAPRQANGLRLRSEAGGHSSNAVRIQHILAKEFSTSLSFSSSDISVAGFTWSSEKSLRLADNFPIFASYKLAQSYPPGPLFCQDLQEANPGTPQNSPRHTAWDIAGPVAEAHCHKEAEGVQRKSFPQLQNERTVTICNRCTCSRGIPHRGGGCIAPVAPVPITPTPEPDSNPPPNKLRQAY